jgi:catechol 2,3-dioxygenase-like lactoylglutathione lyase family enzyme
MASVRPEDQLALELFVRDFQRSLTFYQALGFEVERSDDEFAVLRWEGCGFLLQLSKRLPEVPARPWANIRIMVSDVDEYWRKAAELGAPVFVEIGDRSYGLRDFIVTDPDGFGIRFASVLSRSG